MQIEIKDTAYGGFGVGRGDDGRAVFVPHSVEGDVVEVVITDDKKNFCYGLINKIITPSPMRIKPDCPYAGSCGGCLFAHIGYDNQLKIKERILKNAFRKYPHGLEDIEIAESPRKNYRLRATFRAKNGKIGFLVFKSNDFIPVKHCMIVKESLFEKAKSFIEANSLTGEVYAIETDQGAAFADIKSENRELLSKGAFDGLSWNGLSSGLEHVGYNTPFGAVGIGHKTFFQANLFLLGDFQTYAANLAETSLNITELYAGAGFFTAALQDKCSGISACELDAKASTLAKMYGYPSEKTDAGDFLEKIKETDILFLDPARDGVSNKVIKNILRLKPRKIIYVSCNPMTLARDIIKIETEYKIKNIKLFDMFPDTFHIETVIELEKVRFE